MPVTGATHSSHATTLDYLSSECDKISNFTVAFNECSDARVQAWGAFSGMQLAFKIISALTLSLIVLRDIFLFLFGVDKRGADIPMVMMIISVVLCGGLHAKSFYEGYTFASDAGTHTCMIRFDNFMSVFICMCALLRSELTRTMLPQETGEVRTTYWGRDH